MALCGLVLYPVLWVVRMALTPSQAFSAMGLGGAEGWSPSLQNFVDVVSTRGADGSPLFAMQLFNSVVVALATTAVSLVLAVTAGYAFSRHRFPGRDAGLSGLLVTQMLPGVVMAIPLYVLLDELALLDSLLGLVLVYTTTALPFAVWMVKGYIDTVPKDLEEAALLDGAGQLDILWKVILPMIRPALVVTGLFSFMTAWNEFILAATFLNRESAFTLPVALQSYVGDYNTAWGHFAAGAILVSLPVMGLFFALQKHLVGGLTAGGVKG